MGIVVESLSKAFGSTQVLKDISFSIPRGETTVLLGASGAGKSTLLRMLNLLETPDQGTMKIADMSFNFSNGHDNKHLNKQACALRRKVGMVFQQYNLWPHMTVLDNLIEAPVVQGMPKKQAISKAKELLERVGLSEKAEAWPSSLSGGQQQRVAIARALMLSPDVLLFDEPTAALDPAITNQVVEVIKELSQSGITQVVVTHEVEFARKIASKVIYLEDGHIVEDGSSDHFAHPQTEAFRSYLEH
ncbi:arginine ABC transporter ATP-binding protein ArtP [Endozoicomonas numazuensis]|uniref:Arginine transport ATP-binding protein ArtP n=1 Tax=Endozoicomonas numazuensis TaxID=1137799 RepID=A0A081NJX4_9GAMM|nr:arginine ABC transporter ATP-binding protein ArtP [Endozoicomonas numazuensis]KEQ18747.1 arginine ABC transporter ATP-binding protein [Endozoicomonas numazuensis]